MTPKSFVTQKAAYLAGKSHPTCDHKIIISIIQHSEHTTLTWGAFCLNLNASYRNLSLSASCLFWDVNKVIKILTGPQLISYKSRNTHIFAFTYPKRIADVQSSDPTAVTLITSRTWLKGTDCVGATRYNFASTRQRSAPLLRSVIFELRILPTC